METGSILILDDDAKVRKTLSDILKAKGYVCITAAMGKTALDRVKEERPVLALIDLRLEDMSGLEVMKGINECCPGTECIVLTGYASQASAIEAMNLGAYSYVQKPYDVEQLLVTIQRAIEKRRVEKALRESEEFSSNLLNNSPNPIIVINPDTSVRYVNPALEKVTGFSSLELIGRKAPYPWWTEDTFQETSKDLEKTILEGAQRLEESFQKKNGEIFWVEIISTPIKHNGELKYYLSNWVDVSERKRAEEKLRKANEELERTARDLKKTVAELKKANKKILEQQKSVVEEERLKVLLQMAGATAHELSQPLMALLGNIELMRMNKDHPEKLAQHMALAEETGQRISDIVNKIQTIRHDQTKPYLGELSIIDFDQKIHILSVEDSDNDFETINAILKDHNQINLSRAMSIEEAMEVLEGGQFDLIFLDHILSDGNGIDFLGRMKKKEVEIPVVVITGKGDEMIASQLIQAGAYEYLPKDRLSDKSIFRVIVTTLEKAHLKREIKKAQKKMAEMSTRDELTGLYNRRYFMEALGREVSRAKRYETDLVLCMMDLDHFKRINDTYGHQAGDMVLTEIGKMLKKCIRQSDLVCRYGGEEFAVIFPNVRPEEAHMVCERFKEMVAGHQFKYNSSQFQLTVSTGIAPFSEPKSTSLQKLVDLADQALYQAKDAGRNRVVEYSSSQSPKKKQKM